QQDAGGGDKGRGRQGDKEIFCLSPCLPVSLSPCPHFFGGQPPQRLFDVSFAAQRRRGERARGPYALGGQVSLAQRDGHGELAASVNLALDPHLPRVQLHQFLHEREADAGAFVAAATRALDAVETLEQARRLGFRNARASIPYRED